MTALLRIDRATSTQLRPLPRPVRPVRDEHLNSYLRRLAAANRLDAADLHAHLADVDRRRPHAEIPIDRLALVSGQPPLTLLRCLYLAALPPRDPAGYDRPSERGHARQACRLCMARHGIDVAVLVQLHSEDLVCHHHQRWLGDSTHGSPHSQVPLAAQPDILEANALHRSLLRRYGRENVADAWAAATDVCEGWRRRLEHSENMQMLMRRFHGPTWTVRESDPTFEAASYPQLIAITRLLVTPTWRRMPFDPQQLDTFVDEVRRTAAPNYRWHEARTHGRYEPLVHLYATERRDRRTGHPPRSPIFATAIRRTDPHADDPYWTPDADLVRPDGNRSSDLHA